MWLSDRFPGLMLWHMVAALAAVFAAKALLYWAADWLALGPLYSTLAGPSWDVAAWIAASWPCCCGGCGSSLPRCACRPPSRTRQTALVASVRERSL